MRGKTHEDGLVERSDATLSHPKEKQDELGPSHTKWLRTTATLALLFFSAVTETANAEPLQDSPEPAPNYTRASLEMGAWLGMGAAWYWLDHERNLADWDDLSLRQRFRLSAVRLDNNEFWVNNIGHSWVGAGYYVFARDNHLSIPMASAFAIGTSLLWEYGLEFRERTSYNDFLVTPGAGLAWGEAFYHLGLYLDSGTGSPVSRVLRWTLGFPRALHAWMDGSSTSQAGRQDHLGLSRTFTHRFELSGSIHQLDPRGPEAEHRATRTEAEFNSELFDIHNYGRAGRFSRWFADGNWSRLEANVYSGSPTGSRFYGATTLIGVVTQNLAPANGYAAVFGLGIGFEYKIRDAVAWRQQLSQLDLLEIAGRVDWFPLPSLHLQADASAGSNFSTLNSLAYPQWSLSSAEERGKSILRKEGYYYGWGSHGGLRVSATVEEAVTVAAEGKWTRLNSLDGLDRSQEELQRDEEASDSWSYLRLSFRYAFPALPNSAQSTSSDVNTTTDEHNRLTPAGVTPFVELAVEEQYRDSRLEELRLARKLRQLTFRSGIVF